MLNQLRHRFTYFLKRIWVNSRLAWETDSLVSRNTGNSVSECSISRISWGSMRPSSSPLRRSQGALPGQKMSVSEICPLLYKTVENPETCVSDFNARCLACLRETKMDNCNSLVWTRQEALFLPGPTILTLICLFWKPGLFTCSKFSFDLMLRLKLHVCWKTCRT